ncbi:MAG: hypothetical protein ABIY70_28355 [Capsulimonas sp.]|uniref:hypothetical protein n=1 Tax=Capsulimonas sp. TaxID=2494211 RepID=UPI003267E328
MWIVAVLAVFAALRPVYGAPAVDYLGHPFVTEAAPTLKFERRSSPHRRGIDYPFAEQTARGVALFGRFPPFALSDRRIHISGPWYDSAGANLHFSRGITSVEDMPNFRQGPTNILNIPASQKWQLLGDPLFWTYAKMLADELTAADSKDPRIASLRTLAVDHKMVGDKAAYLALGRRVWQGERQASDAKGHGVLYPSIDIEATGGWEHQRDCFGWLYQGMASEAVTHGDHIVPVTYGQWTYSVGAFDESVRQGGTGDPEYLLPERDFLAAPDPTLQACEDSGGVVAMDGYMQAIWGSEPLYKHTTDGAIQMRSGRPVFSDLTHTTLYGADVPLEPGEAEHTLHDLYRQAVRMYLMYHRMAGQYPDASDRRKPFLKNVRVSAWTRITNEGMQGIQQNDRPLPGWMIEMLTGMYLFTADDIVVWSSDTNTPPGPMGADYTKAWKYNTPGVMEYLVKGAHRYSALDPLHHGAFQWCWFHLPVVAKNAEDGERYDQKPIVFGKLRPLAGKTWLELFAAWPSLDNRPAQFQIWIDKGGKRSAAYTIELADGRHSFYDAWRLPDGFQNLEGRDIWLRFKDSQGVTRTWRGDWRAPVDSKVTTPPAYQEPRKRKA